VTHAAEPREREGDGGNGWYVYGVLAAGEAAPEDFTGVRGVDSGAPIVLVDSGSIAAIASEVPLAEFGEEAIEQNLRLPEWLEARVRAHEAVLEAALAQAPVVPFRFGTIFRSVDHVRSMLDEHRDFEQTLDDLRGRVELGVKGFLDQARFDAARRGETDDEPASGRAYMRRKQLDRQLAEERESFKGELAQESDRRLSEAADAGRLNPLQRPEVSGREGEMFLNAAYLVRSEDAEAFRAALRELVERYRAEGAAYELSGPWPPYNFVEAENVAE
jgi:hypothetical protein